ncbi:MAG: ABC transporter ATP-binding protein [Deltaproteobacteria bacterium]|nr:ABC transporter ATP-binding protein [Deltaproteobacteria bacterium]MBW2085126.1 ABC transporter ATP-binding protein [Deltaproteobacteria bacterium]
MPPLLEVKNLQTQFFIDNGVVKAVDGVSFDLNEGETLGLVGESGCGKSVSALSILRLIPYPPGKIVGGEIIFEGRDLLKISEEEIRDVRGNRIAMIFQEPMTSLNPALTIGRQVSEPMEVHQGLRLKQALEKSKELLGKVQIAAAESRVADYPHQFSGGMRQRTMIAMGLGCGPKLIIADEPTTALDVTIQAQLLELMKNLTRDFGMALMIITHNLGVVARYADRVNVMYAGRIVEKGTADDIYDDPKHPYTIGLMASVPILDQDIKRKLVPIHGQPPDLSDIPPGCAFHPRCTYAVGRCREETPVLKSVGGKHEKACWIDV